MSIYLIVADRAAWSMGLARKLQNNGARDRSAEFVVVVPADLSYMADEAVSFLQARETAARARTSLQLLGLTVLEALAGPAPPRKGPGARDGPRLP